MGGLTIWGRLLLVAGALTIAVAAAAALVVLLDEMNDDESAETVAERFEGRTVYWLGEEYNGLQLERALDTPPSRGLGGGREATMIYGSCDPSGSDGGCAPPIAIITLAGCNIPSGFNAPATDPFYLGEAVATYDGGGLLLWTRDVTVQIFAHTVDDPVGVARNLRLVGSAADEPDHLQPPTFLPCPARPLGTPPPSPVPFGTVEAPPYYPGAQR